MAMSRPTRRDEFGVAIVCALPLEFDAVALALDEIWPESLGKAAGDYNTYTLGRIGNQNVVLVLLPNMGKTSAAGAAASLRHSFTALKLAFLCGICGGVPNPKPDVEIVLGDVIISESVVQYDYGRRYPSKFAHKDTCNDAPGRPIREIRSLLTFIKTDFGSSHLQREIPDITKQIQLKSAGPGQKYKCPGYENDVLFRASYPHRHRESDCGCDEDNICEVAVGTSCAELQCEPEAHVPRARLQKGTLSHQRATPETAQPQPRVFIGNVASGDTVMKSGIHRDNLAKDHDIIAFEMEGAGVWDEVPCIIVKSVCDYADSHKNKEWQGFAAATAASATKILIGKYVSAMPPAAAERAHDVSRSFIEATEESGPAFLVPYPENPDFVRRSEVFDRLIELFGHTNSHHQIGNKMRSKVALYGLGGVGKTQIALAYCYWFRDRFPDAHVLWVHASNIDRFRQAFADIAQECNIAGHETTGDILALVKKWLENRKAGRWLLVIDNADDLEVFFPPSPSTKDGKLSSQNPEAETRVGRFIPNCNHGSILITTRNKQAGLRLAPGKDSVIEVSRMTETETESLLRSLILEDEDISSQETSLLSNRLEHLPLAIAQAASFINENFISINEYIKLLDQSDLSLVERLSEPFEAVGRDSETPHALTATWMISFIQIKQQYPLASDALAFISLLDRQAIPKQLIWDYCYDKLEEQASSEDPFDKDNVGLQVTKILGTLLAFSFLSRAGEDLFDMHRLVQLTTHKRLVDDKCMDSYANSAVATISRSYLEGISENQIKCQKYLPHALAVLERTQLSAREARLQAADIKCEVSRHLSIRQFHEDSVRIQKEALETRVELLGQEDADTLFSMEYLAEMYRQQGRNDEALKILLPLLETRQRLQGTEHRDTLFTKFSVARTYKRQGEYSKAEQLHLQELEVQKRLLGHEHHDVLSTMHDLAVLYLDSNRLKESEELCLRLMSAEGWAPQHKSITAHILCEVYLEQNRLGEAHELSSSLCEQRMETLGEDDPFTLRSLQLLADVRGKQGHKAEKEEISRRVLETKRRVWGNTSTFTLAGIVKLAEALEGIGELGEAEELRREHFESTLQIFGNRDDKTLTSMHLLALIWFDMGRQEDAAKKFEECFKGRKQILGHEHEYTVFTQHGLACSWREIGRVEDAAKLFEKCLEDSKRILGHGHKNTLSTMHELAFTSQRLGRVEEAAKVYEECLEGRRQTIGSNHEDTLTTMYNLADCFHSLGREDDAIKLMWECVDGRKQTLGEDHAGAKRAIAALSKYEERLEVSRCEGEDASISDNASRDGLDDNSGSESDAPVLRGSNEDSDSHSDGGSWVLLTESS